MHRPPADSGFAFASDALQTAKPIKRPGLSRSRYKQNVISNCASALRRSRLRIGAVRSRARKQAVVAQTITSPCLETTLYVVNRTDRLLIKPDILTRSRQGQIVPWHLFGKVLGGAHGQRENG